MNKDKCASLPFFSQPEQAEDTFFYERQLSKQGFSVIAGVDEAGRGPLAGPVVAGCVHLSFDCDFSSYKDSKKLTSRKREQAFTLLYNSDAVVGVGIATVAEIEQINILQASLLAMKRAVTDCCRNKIRIDFLLVDGKFAIPMDIAQQPLVQGESKSSSIAAASIVAKVTRDRLMATYHEKYPQYNFIQHQGYPTKAHRQAITEYGPSPIHRKTFKGVREFFEAPHN